MVKNSNKRIFMIHTLMFSSNEGLKGVNEVIPPACMNVCRGLLQIEVGDSVVPSRCRVGCWISGCTQEIVPGTDSTWLMASWRPHPLPAVVAIHDVHYWMWSVSECKAQRVMCWTPDLAVRLRVEQVLAIIVQLTHLKQLFQTPPPFYRHYHVCDHLLFHFFNDLFWLGQVFITWREKTPRSSGVEG